MQTGSLRLDQAPPLAVPASFFLVAPLSITAAGATLLVGGVPTSAWAPQTIALTHFGTLGLLGAVMFGALYQLIPVVAGVPVPAVRLAHVALAALIAGIATLTTGIGFTSPPVAELAAWTLGTAVLLFVLPVAVALVRAPARTAPVRGMRLALVGLVLLAAAGVWMSRGWAGHGFAAPRLVWLQAHLLVALLGWVGALLSAVSLQLVPMFYLAEPIPPGGARAVRWLIALGLACIVAAFAVVLAADPALPWLLPLAAAPAAVAVWLLHPALALRSIARHHRRRPDPTLTFWKVGLAVAPAVFLCGVAATALPSPRLPLLFGWLAIWGWAGTILLGTLSRIVPFLVWFHRYSALVGRVKVPSMKALLPDARVRLGFWTHMTGLTLGAAAIATGMDPLARAAGAVILVEGLLVGAALVHVLSQRPTGQEQALARPEKPAVARMRRDSEQNGGTPGQRT